MQPGKAPAGFIGEFHRLDEGKGRALRQNLGELRGAVRAGQRRDLNLLEIIHAPLADNVERAERLDLVAKELNANRPVPVGREEIHDPTAAGKRPGHLDRVVALPAASHQPVGQFRRIERAAHLKQPRAG